MKFREILCTMVVVAVAASVLPGCFLFGPNIEVWVINTSDFVTVTHVEIRSIAETGSADLKRDVAPSTTRVFTNVNARRLQATGVTLILEGESEDPAFEAQAQFTIQTPIEDGDILPVVVWGNNPLSFRGQYVPLEGGSKDLQRLRKYLPRELL